jgi:muramoyltetrapeptide carboxypeptidase
MAIRFPAPLRPGDRIGVTASSMGVGRAERVRLEQAVAAVAERGYQVVLGACLDGASHVSGPAADRAAELMSMLTDPSIRAVVPPRGGETAIDLLPLLDWDAIAAAEPTWFIGFSDISTLLLPVTLRSGLATLHTNNLLNTPYRVGRPLLTWLDVAALPPGAAFAQSPPGRGGTGAIGGPDGYGGPGTSAGWARLDSGGPVRVTGRLIGGCIETVRHLAGTPYGDITGFRRQHAADGLIVYLEAADDDAYSICRSLHGMRLAGFFTGATAVLVASTLAPDSRTMTQHEAVLDALGGLGVPIVTGLGCGHVPPYLPVVNGALGRLELGPGQAVLTQVLR